MSPERATALVRRWVAVYVRDLPPALAERRVAEIEADLHDHVAHERARGTSDRRIAASVLSRAVRGLPDDASWRRAQAGRSGVPGGAPALRGPLARVLPVVGLLLLLPLVGTLLTDGVAWGVFDFAAAAALLAGAGLAVDRLARGRGGAHRLATGVAVGALLLLVWSVLALGVAGDPGTPADRLFGVTLVAAVVGTVRARGLPQGMTRAFVGVAAVQVLVTGLVLAVGGPGADATDTALVGAFFAALFLLAAALFSRGGRSHADSSR